MLVVVAKSIVAKQNKDLYQEQENHEDIIQLGHMDLYKNLTLKSLMAFISVAKCCSEVHYVLINMIKDKWWHIQ